MQTSNNQSIDPCSLIRYEVSDPSDSSNGDSSPRCHGCGGYTQDERDRDIECERRSIEQTACNRYSEPQYAYTSPLGK
jgi:hypothetical protein